MGSGELLFGDCNQQIGRHGDPDLALHSVLRAPKKLVDAQMLLDPFEEQFDLPPAPVKIADCLCCDLEVYGLPETNEVVVRASAAGKEFYKAAPSRLTYPAMIDRRFGIDVTDNQLAEELSNALWAEHGEELKTLIEKPGSE